MFSGGRLGNCTGCRGNAKIGIILENSSGCNNDSSCLYLKQTVGIAERKSIMRTFCSYHPTKPAHFSCSRCNGDYCSGCVTKRSFERYGRAERYYYCPKCEGVLDRLAISNVIDPFWNRLPKLFLYPFHPRP